MTQLNIYDSQVQSELMVAHARLQTKAWALEIPIYSVIRMLTLGTFE